MPSLQSAFCSLALESWGRLESEASRCNCGSGERNHVGSVTTAMQPIAKLAGGGQKDCPRSPSLALALDGFTNWIVKARKKRTLDGGSDQAGERASEDKREEAGIIDPRVVNRAVVGSELSSLPSVFLSCACRQGLIQVSCTLWKIWSWACNI